MSQDEVKGPNREEQRRLVKQWGETGRELEAIRKAELRGKPYDWREVDALLQLADYYDGPERTTSGLVEMQRWFMKLHPKYFPVDEKKE
jgi:hypothetical protein